MTVPVLIDPKPVPVPEPTPAKPRAKPLRLPLLQNAMDANKLAGRLIRIAFSQPPNVREMALQALAEHFAPKPTA